MNSAKLLFLALATLWAIWEVASCDHSGKYESQQECLEFWEGRPDLQEHCR